MNQLGPTLVSHPCLYLSACPISHSFWCFVSCVEPDIIVQGSYPHKCGQDVSSGHLIWRWQFLLELLLHHTPMADSLHLCFPLGRSARLPLVACRFFLPWSRFTEDRIVLDNISWQFGPSSFVLGHLFLLGMGLRLDMIMGQGCQIHWPHKRSFKTNKRVILFYRKFVSRNRNLNQHKSRSLLEVWKHFNVAEEIYCFCQFTILTPFISFR